MQFSLSQTANHVDVIGNEFYHLYKQPGDPFLMAICSERKLTSHELAYLFINIKHAHLRPTALHFDLDDIVRNPIGFIGKDMHIEGTKQQLKKVRDIMLDNIEKAIKRHEKLESLTEKTIQLEAESIRFNKSAKRLNNRCCGMM